MDTKKYKIFIASSLTDGLQIERSELYSFVKDLGDSLETSYNLKLEPYRCESRDPRYSGIRAQDEINLKLAESDMVLFIFNHDAGKFTLEELKLATEEWEKKGLPLIYIFFKNIDSNEGDTPELSELKNNLIEDKGHYAEFYSHIDTIKLRIILSIQSKLKEFPALLNKDGYLMLDNIRLVNLENVAEFSNNTTLQALQEEIEYVENNYNSLKPDVKGAYVSPIIKEECHKLEIRRKQLSEQLNQLQQKIFEMSINMCHDTLYGNISSRQKEAYRVFQLGDYKRCISILSQEELDEDFYSTQSQLEEYIKQNAQKYINENILAIKILNISNNDPTRFAQIEQRFKKIIPLVEKYQLEMNTIYYYAAFLFEQNRFNKAYEYLCRIDKYYENTEEDSFKIEKSKINNVFGVFYCLKCDYEQSDIRFKKVQAVGEALVAKGDTKFNMGLARIDNNRGVIMLMQKKISESAALFESAYSRLNVVVEQGDKEYFLDSVRVMQNLGYTLLFSDIDKAETEFDRILYICYECLGSDDYDKYELDVSIEKLHIAKSAVSYMRSEYSSAEKMLLKAEKKAADLNNIFPGNHNHDLAVICSCLGCVYRSMNEPEKADSYFSEAHKWIRALCETSSIFYERDANHIAHMMSGGDEFSDWPASELLQRYILSVFI